MSNYLLQENGYFLLQENGDKIIINLDDPGYNLDYTQIKSPKTFKREYVFQKTDFTAINGKVTRDKTGKKEKYLLIYENLSVSEVATLLAIIEKNQSVYFSVDENAISINKYVFPYIGGIEYSKVGSDYLASLSLELIEEE